MAKVVFRTFPSATATKHWGDETLGPLPHSSEPRFHWRVQLARHGCWICVAVPLEHHCHPAYRREVRISARAWRSPLQDGRTRSVPAIRLVDLGPALCRIGKPACSASRAIGPLDDFGWLYHNNGPLLHAEYAADQVAVQE